MRVMGLAKSDISLTLRWRLPEAGGSVSMPMGSSFFFSQRERGVGQERRGLGEVQIVRKLLFDHAAHYSSPIHNNMYVFTCT